MKRCRKCGRLKALTAFYAHPTMRDGRLNKCKQCCVQYIRELRAKFPERFRLRDWFYIRKSKTRERRNAWFAARRKAS